jgi:hypothetical protein
MSSEFPAVRDAFGVRGCSWEATGLVIDPATSFADWEQIVVTLVQAELAVQWAIGDAFLFGESRFGEVFAQVEGTLERAGLRRSPETLRNWMWVASKIAPARRRRSLSFRHHQLVARLQPDEQTAWLDRAEREGMATGRLREQLRYPDNTELAPAEESAEPIAGLTTAARALVESATPDASGEFALVPLAALDALAAALGEERKLFYRVEEAERRPPWA